MIASAKRSVTINNSSSPRVLWFLLVGGAACYFSFFAFYPQLFSAIGVNYFGVWFLDSFAILASNDALARGLDVYAANPLDYLQRPHVYTHWWLELGKFGFTRADNFWLGLVIVLTFLGAALANLRPRTRAELLWFFAVLCSSPVVLAVHRANNDLVIFLLLAPVVPCLLSVSRSARVLAVLLIAFATALKIYPAAAGLILLAGVESRTVRVGLGLAALAMFVVMFGLQSDFARMAAMLPHVKAEGLMTFGAGNLFGIGGITGWGAIVAGGALGLVIAVALVRTRFFEGWVVAPADQLEWLYFVLGSALLTGCFFTGMNFAYRWVFALWLAPFLWRSWHNRSMPSRVRRLATVTGGLLMVVLWADPLAAAVLTLSKEKVSGAMLVRWADWFFLAEQPFTWAFFVCLLSWLVHFARGRMQVL